MKVERIQKYRMPDPFEGVVDIATFLVDMAEEIRAARRWVKAVHIDPIGPMFHHPAYVTLAGEVEV